MDEVKWLSQEYNGEKWYSELSEVALELIRRFVISYHTTKGGYAPEARTFDLRNVMAPSAGKMHAPLKSMAPGRAPLPVPVETLKACPQPDRDGMIGEAPEFDPEDGVRIKTDIAGSWSPPVPLKQIEGRFNEARDLNAVFTSDFTKNLDGNRARFGTDLPAGLPLPDEYYNSDRPLWSPPEVGTTYHTEFSKRFAAADIWGKTLIWQDLIDAEIARIDTQMMAMMNRRQVLEAEKEQGIQHYEEMQRRKEALAQAYRENEIGRREVDAIHKKAEREMKISLKTFGGSGSGIQDKLSRAKRSSGSELLLNASVRAQSPHASVRAQSPHASFQGGIRGAGVLDTLRRVPAFEDPRTITQQVRSPLGSEFLASVSGGGTNSSFAMQSSPTMDTEQDAQFSDNEEQVTEDEEREEEYGEDVGEQEEEEFDEASRAVPEELESSHMSGSYHHELKPGDPDQPGAPQTEMFESTLTTAGMRENVG